MTNGLKDLPRFSLIDLREASIFFHVSFIKSLSNSLPIHFLKHQSLISSYFNNVNNFVSINYNDKI